MNYTLDLNSLLTIDETGMPKAPTLAQLQDKDIKLLYARDTSKDKIQYLKEVGVIWFLADPKAPAIQEGLSRTEALKKAIENYDLPSNYIPDLLVEKLIKKYHDRKIGVAGEAVESLKKAVHNLTIATNILNERLNEKLSAGISDEDANTIIDFIDKISKRVIDLPNLIKSLNEAEETLRQEEELVKARGGNKVVSSQVEED